VGRHDHEDRVARIRKLFEPSHKFSHVYDHPGMRADPDLPGAFGCTPRELDLPPVDLCHFGLPVGLCADFEMATSSVGQGDLA
jgi:hypothetical protein